MQPMAGKHILIAGSVVAVVTLLAPWGVGLIYLSVWGVQPNFTDSFVVTSIVAVAIVNLLLWVTIVRVRRDVGVEKPLVQRPVLVAGLVGLFSLLSVVSVFVLVLVQLSIFWWIQ